MGNGPKQHRWREIADLPEHLDPLRDRELESLFEVWANEEERIGDDKSIAAFNDRLRREWAIETGIIEGVYTLDRGITQTLIERGIDAAYISHGSTNCDPELVARIVQAHAEVLEGLFSFVKSERELTAGYIKELHAALMRYQDTVGVFDELGRSFEVPLEKGVYKRLPNNPTRADGSIHEYCPPEHVASEIDRMLEMHRKHSAHGVDPHVEATWLHHASTQIHPFQDGNGRVARTLATLVLIKAGYFPLVVNRDDQERYIDALEAADDGDLARLVRVFAQLQKRALTNAIGLAVEAKPAETLDEAIAATRDLLINLGKIIPRDFLAAKTIAGKLFHLAVSRLGGLISRLDGEIAAVDPTFAFSRESFDSPPSSDIRSVGEKLKYDPNLAAFHQSQSIALTKGDVSSKIVVFFHGVGATFRGLLVAVCYFQAAEGDAIPLSDDVFRITYNDSQAEIAPRFEQWLEDCLIEGIARWRRTLV